MIKRTEKEDKEVVITLYCVTITSNLPIPMYEIKSVDKPEEGVIKGMFYGHELTSASKE